MQRERIGMVQPRGTWTRVGKAEIPHRPPGPSLPTCQDEFFLLSIGKQPILHQVKRRATFDSSFWVHAVYLDLVDFLLDDYTLVCPKAVERELGGENPAAERLRALRAQGQIQRAKARVEKIKLYGLGERAAINLALERSLLLLIDDWRPYEAAAALGVETVNIVAYVVHLFARDRISADRVFGALAKLVKRRTLRSEWTSAGLKLVAEIRRQRTEKG